MFSFYLEVRKPALAAAVQEKKNKNFTAPVATGFFYGDVIIDGVLSFQYTRDDCL